MNPGEEAKNASNERDHGISFETARLAFDDEFAVTAEDYLDGNGEMRYHTIGLIEGFPIFVAHVYRLLDGEEIPWIISARRRSNMKKQSTGQISEKAKREIEALRRMPDSEVNFSDIPLQNLNDPKWANAVVGKFYRPIKKPVALRLDADVIAWFKEQGRGYQSRINEVLRREMNSHR